MIPARGRRRRERTRPAPVRLPAHPLARLAWLALGLFVASILWSMWVDSLRPIVRAGDAGRALLMASGLALVLVGVAGMLQGAWLVLRGGLSLLADETFAARVQVIRDAAAGAEARAEARRENLRAVGRALGRGLALTAGMLAAVLAGAYCTGVAERLSGDAAVRPDGASARGTPDRVHHLDERAGRLAVRRLDPDRHVEDEVGAVGRGARAEAPQPGRHDVVLARHDAA